MVVRIDLEDPRVPESAPPRERVIGYCVIHAERIAEAVELAVHARVGEAVMDSEAPAFTVASLRFAFDCGMQAILGRPVPAAERMRHWRRWWGVVGEIAQEINDTPAAEPESHPEGT